MTLAVLEKRLPLHVRWSLLVPAAVALLIALFGCIALLHRPLDGFKSAVLWAVVLMGSFAGWGTLVERQCLASRVASLGLRATWGMALMLAVGGVLCATGLASHFVLMGLVLAGLGVWMIEVWRPSESDRFKTLRFVARWKHSAPVQMAIAFCLLLAMFDLLGWTAFDNLSSRDDRPAYLPFVREILDRGTLLQPYSFRKICVLGGQEFLHALHLSVGLPSKFAHAIDGGVCVVMLVAVVAGQLIDVRKPSRVMVVVAALIAATLPSVRSNIATEVSTALFLVALYCTWESRAFQDASGTRKHWVVGLLVAGVCTLRNTNIIPCAAMVAYLYGTPLLARDARRDPALRRLRLRDLAVVTAAIFVCLVAWMVLSYRSSGTPLFPLFKGFYSKDFGLGLTGQRTFARGIVGLFGQVAAAPNDRGWPFFALAALALGSRYGSTLFGLFLAEAVVAFTLGYCLPDCPPKEVGRYQFGFYYAFEIATCLSFARLVNARMRPADFLPGIALLAVGLSVYVGSTWDNFSSGRGRFLASIVAKWPQTDPWKPADPDASEGYRDLQIHVPPGAIILSMVDDPYHFDYHRNPIYLFDLPGAVGPPHGVPLLKGEAALVEYFRSQGIRYMFVEGPTTSEAVYRYSEWEQLMTPAAPYFQTPAKYILDALTSLDKLAHSKQAIWTNANGTFALLDFDVN